MTFPSKQGTNYEDSIAGLVLVPLTWIFICIRIYVRGFLTRQPGWDDVACVIAGIAYLVECVTSMMSNQVSSTIGYPPSMERLILSFKWYVAGAALYAGCCLVVKLSLGLGLLRILNVRHFAARWERIVCYVTIVFSCAVNLLLMFYILFECAGNGIMPSHEAAGLVEGKCTLTSRGLKVTTYVHSAGNVLVDIIIVLLPLPTILATTMDWKLRLSLFLILFLGALGTTASIIRLAYVHTFWTPHPKTGAIGTIVSIVEIGIFIISSCLATFHPLVAKFLPIMDSYHSRAHASLQIPGEKDPIVEQQDSPKRQSSDVTTV